MSGFIIGPEHIFQATAKAAHFFQSTDKNSQTYLKLSQLEYPDLSSKFTCSSSNLAICITYSISVSAQRFLLA